MSEKSNDVNVVSIDEYKKKASLNNSKTEYKRYLTLLKSNELEDEVLHILDENSPSGFNLSMMDKSKLILSEIADRSAPSISKYINKMKSHLEV